MADVTQKDRKQDNSESDDENYDPQEEVVDNAYKQVDLPEIPVVTGEQDQQVIEKWRSKIYRWRNQWKERGVGELKLAKNKNTGLIRVLVRAQKTHKIIVNHLLQRKNILCVPQPMKTSNNAWHWSGYDVSDETPAFEKFCAKFTSKQDSEKFKVAFDKACEQNAAIFDKNSNEPKLEEANKQQVKKEETVEQKKE